MGRIFEKRKHKMFARYSKMAKMFTRIGKDIAMAVKQNGPNPDTNPKLRQAIQNARGVNMPKDRVDAAIKRASDKDTSNYEEIVYEGYGPHGVAILVEASTDNPTRTVANVRMYFNRNGGSLGTKGMLDFIFERKSVFNIEKGNLNIDELELDLIDYGCEGIEEEEDGTLSVYGGFTDFGTLYKALEDKGVVIKNSDIKRFPTTVKEGLTEEQEKEIEELINKIEEDEDVNAVFHNMA